MVKVAFFAEILIEEFDGASRTMFQIINRIDPDRFSYLFVYGKGPAQLDKHASLRIPTLNTKLNKDYTFTIPALVKEQLKQELDAFQPDVVHIATPSLLGFFALRYARQRGIPVISIYHTNFISYVPYYFRKFPALIKPVEKWMISASRKFYNACDMVYVPSRSMVRELMHFGIQESKLTLWQRGINLNLFRPDKRSESYIQAITGNAKPNILFASRLVWEKNIQTLIDIYHRLKRANLPHNLIIAGNGAAQEEMKKQMPEAFFLGKLEHEQLATLYASCDVFLFTSTSETYGNVVVEAMASGLPCVIADGGGSADLIRHRHTGYKCKPKSPEDYIIYLRLLLNDPELHQVISNAALAEVQQLDWKKLTDRYFDDVTQLAGTAANDLVWAAC
ncbi:MAG TPA: glycosyltransferase family 1 protein [Sphingobacterium sp.]|jgi:glycosyltransferase involved in cell wall biosynthesis|nr:glycosyltransferase family 1 protein [Sphingobacterium sp.]